MRTYFDCIPCFTRQTLDVVRLVSDDEAKQEQILRQSLELLSEIDLRQPPPVMARRVHAAIREVTGIDDPYRDIKVGLNEFALSLLPELRRRVAESEDAFETALRLAIAGNIIDLGVGSAVDEDTVHEAIDHALSARLDADVDEFRSAAGAARDILYLADNAGEIVLDRLLIERLPHGKITLVVKGGPALNDALHEDAESAGLTGLMQIIDNGSNVPGTWLSDCSSAFRQRFAAADLVISKGQGNYETLSDVLQDIFFLLKVKCPVIARDIGAGIGDLVLRRCGISEA